MTGEFFALFLGLTIFYAGGFAEVVRAGILSVSKGQSEAARALGLSEGQRLQLIVLPQALRVIIPPMISTYLSPYEGYQPGCSGRLPRDLYHLANANESIRTCPADNACPDDSLPADQLVLLSYSELV